MNWYARPNAVSLRPAFAKRLIKIVVPNGVSDRLRRRKQLWVRDIIFCRDAQGRNAFFGNRDTAVLRFRLGRTACEGHGKHRESEIFCHLRAP